MDQAALDDFRNWRLVTGKSGHSTLLICGRLAGAHGCTHDPCVDSRDGALVWLSIR